MNYIRKILHGCKEASMLALQSQEERLPFKKQLQYRLHLLICSSCRNFVKQATRLEGALRSFFQDPDEGQAANPEFKAKLKDRLK